jgi:hypothetical protein
MGYMQTLSILYTGLKESGFGYPRGSWMSMLLSPGDRAVETTRYSSGAVRVGGRWECTFVNKNIFS